MLYTIPYTSVNAYSYPEPSRVLYIYNFLEYSTTVFNFLGDSNILASYVTRDNGKGNIKMFLDIMQSSENQQVYAQNQLAFCT